MDFSQFGGPAAVTAQETAPGSNHWTASYQIAPGSIDGIANVAVTATNATGSATAWDTANLSVDDEYPVVTDPHISITSTGSGPGGAYLPGDALTVRWDNSPNGDHNADALAATNPVMVDFSQLGGGSVAATETAPGSNLWTATYTVTGATRGTTLHVSVTVTDDAGNATTAADTTNLILMSGTTTTVTTDHLTGSVYGDLLTFTATVTTTPPGTGTPPGTVTFVGNFVGGSLPLGTESLGLNGIATFSTASLPAGSYTVTAIYSGSTTFDGSTSAVGANANVAPKALDVTATDRTKTYGDAVTFAGTEFTTSGLVNGDTVTGVTLTSAGAAATATVAGSPYAIVASDAVGTGLGNYAIVYHTGGTLSVTPKALDVTATTGRRPMGTR